MGDDIRLTSMKSYGTHELELAKSIEYSVARFVEAAPFCNKAIADHMFGVVDRSVAGICTNLCAVHPCIPLPGLLKQQHFAIRRSSLCS